MLNMWTQDFPETLDLLSEDKRGGGQTIGGQDDGSPGGITFMEASSFFLALPDTC